MKYANNGAGSGTITSFPELGASPGFTLATANQKNFLQIQFPVQSATFASPATATLDRNTFLKYGAAVTARSVFFGRFDLEIVGRYQIDRLIDATEGTSIALVTAQLAQVQGNAMVRLIGNSSTHGGLGVGYIHTSGAMSGSPQRQGTGISVFSYFTGGAQRAVTFRSEFLIDTLRTEFGSQGQLQMRLGITWDIPFYKRVVPSSSSDEFPGE